MRMSTNHNLGRIINGKPQKAGDLQVVECWGFPKLVCQQWKCEILGSREGIR